jgi:GMP synthase (glutamine-hydrolysing)
MARHELGCVRRRFAGRQVEVDTVNVLDGPVSAERVDGYDAVVFGGSGDYSVHDPRSAAWVAGLRDMLDRTLARRIPGFGLCFGHQLLGAHMGATVATEPDHAELGTVEVQLSQGGVADPIFCGLEQDFHAHTGHSDAVVDRPAGVTVLASNEALATQAFKVDGAPFYSTQFHPDLTGAEAVNRYLAYHRSLASAQQDPSLAGASRFRPGADAATILLGRFLDAVGRDELE